MIDVRIYVESPRPRFFAVFQRRTNQFDADIETFRNPVEADLFRRRTAGFVAFPPRAPIAPQTDDVPPGLGLSLPTHAYRLSVSLDHQSLWKS